MKKYIIISFIILFGCGSPVPVDVPQEQDMTVKIPDWYLTKPEKEGYRYVVATELSNLLRTAVEQAEKAGRTGMAAAMQVEITSFSSDVQEEVNNIVTLNRYNSVQDEVFANVLSDCSIIKKEVFQEKYTNMGKEINGFRVYVLVEYDFGAAQKRLMDNIQADQELYEVMKATELMNNMEQKVEEYRKRRGY